MFITYILQSEKNGKHYIGSTDDIIKRIIKHNKGYSRYTKGKGPFKLVYKEEYPTRSQAKKREYYLKSLKNVKFIEKLIKNGSVV